MADFNLPDCDWQHYHGPTNAVYNSFLSFINTHGFMQFVYEPTRDSSILDLVFSNVHDFILDVFLLPPINTSDHSVMIFKPNIDFSADTFIQLEVLLCIY